MAENGLYVQRLFISNIASINSRENSWKKDAKFGNISKEKDIFEKKIGIGQTHGLTEKQYFSN